jgi:hypothetical protein
MTAVSLFSKSLEDAGLFFDVLDTATLGMLTLSCREAHACTRERMHTMKVNRMGMSAEDIDTGDARWAYGLIWPEESLLRQPVRLYRNVWLFIQRRREQKERILSLCQAQP